jgi:hypothetical protein
MPTVYVYVVAASSDPDRVACTVPWRVDDELIFFGPCKKRIREALRARYLRADRDQADVTDSVYLVGVNGGNAARTRKIVWAGRLRRVFTFARAHEELVDPRFRAMREHDFSPLHLLPIRAGGRLVGYEHRGREHAEHDNWVLDLVTHRRSSAVRQASKRLLLQPSYTPWDAFPRDVCLLLDNVFFVTGKGLAPDSALLDILRRRQPGKEITPYALFGLQPDGSADGMRGSYLQLEGDLADQLLGWIQRRIGAGPRSAPVRRASSAQPSPPTSVPRRSRSC